MGGIRAVPFSTTTNAHRKSDKLFPNSPKNYSKTPAAHPFL